MDAIVSRLGQQNASGSVDALFLKVFAGEVMTAFAETNVAKERHLVRSIASGKSAQFPATWKASAEYHTPGAEITGGKIKHNERVITIDDLLISPVFIASIDEAKNHYDVRSIYSVEAGRALANKYDDNVLRNGLLSSRASATIDDGYGGGNVTSANCKTTVADLLAAILDAGQILDEKDVAEADRAVFLRPAQYWLLLESEKVINKDYGAGIGDLRSAKVWRLGDLEIVKTNHLPITDLSADDKYPIDASNTAALVMNRMACGTVELIGLAIESEYDIRRQGTLIVSKYAVGHGILRPECAVEIDTA